MSDYLENHEKLTELREEITNLGTAFLPLCAQVPDFKALPELLFTFTDTLEYVSNRLEELDVALDQIQTENPETYMSLRLWAHLNGEYWALTSVLLYLENKLTVGEEISGMEGLD
jgi:hypothetical protein